MSWSYSGDPSLTDLDMVRFLIGDTDTDDQQVSDEEITAMLTEASDDVYSAAVLCVESLIAKYARKPSSKSVGDLSITYGELTERYEKLLAKLRKRQSLALAAPYAGGISVSDKATVEEDTDRVEPTFKQDLHKNLYTS